FQDSVDRVVDDVEEDLLELMGIGGDRGQAGFEIAIYPNVVELEIVFAQDKSFFKDAAEIHLKFLRLVLAGEGEQVLHDSMGTLRLFEQFADKILGVLIEAFTLEELGVTENGGEGIV